MRRHDEAAKLRCTAQLLRHERTRAEDRGPGAALELLQTSRRDQLIAPCRRKHFVVPVREARVGELRWRGWECNQKRVRAENGNGARRLFNGGGVVGHGGPWSRRSGLPDALLIDEWPSRRVTKFSPFRLWLREPAEEHHGDHREHVRPTDREQQPAGHLLVLERGECGDARRELVECRTREGRRAAATSRDRGAPACLRRDRASALADRSARAQGASITTGHQNASPERNHALSSTNAPSCVRISSVDDARRVRREHHDRERDHVRGAASSPRSRFSRAAPLRSSSARTRAASIPRSSNGGASHREHEKLRRVHAREIAGAERTAGPVERHPDEHDRRSIRQSGARCSRTCARASMFERLRPARVRERRARSPRARRQDTPASATATECPRAEHHHCTFTTSFHLREQRQIVRPICLARAEWIDHVRAVIRGECDHLRRVSHLVVARGIGRAGNGGRDVHRVSRSPSPAPECRAVR